MSRERVAWGSLEPRIRQFLTQEMGIDEGEIGLEEALVTTGLIDSMGLVRLVTCLERETGIRIPDRDVKADRFDSLDLIRRYLAERGVV